MKPEIFGCFIQTRRKELMMTQTQLAEKLNVTAKAVSRWERGVGFPDIQLLQPLADALEISITELMQSRRMAPEEREKESIHTVELIRQQESLSRRRKLVLNAGRTVIFLALLFLLIQVRRVPWEEPWLVYVVRIILMAGGWGFARMWEYILEKGWLKDQPFGIWHSKHTWVWAGLAFAGAMLLARSWLFDSVAGYVLALIGGFALIVGALHYYAIHEHE